MYIELVLGTTLQFWVRAYTANSGKWKLRIFPHCQDHMSLKMLSFHNIFLPIKYNTLSCLVQVVLGAERRAKEKKMWIIWASLILRLEEQVHAESKPSYPQDSSPEAATWVHVQGVILDKTFIIFSALSLNWLLHDFLFALLFTHSDLTLFLSPPSERLL